MTRLRYLLRERDVRGKLDQQVLSVYRDHGVVPKGDRDDNFNKTPEDLSLYKLVRRGDLVVNKMKAWQGSLAISDFDGIVSGDYLVCEVNSIVDRRYLHSVLRSRPMIGEYAVRSKGIRPSQWRLYWDDLADIDVALAEPAEQRAIADFLDAETARIDQLIARQQQLLAALDLRWEAFVETLLGDLSPQPVKRFATKIGSGSTPTGGSDVYVSEGVRFLRSQNVRDGQVDLSDVVHITADQDAELQRTRLRTGDVLLNITGGSIGRTALVTESVLPANVSQHVCLIRCRRGVDPLLVQVSLQSRMVQDQIRLVQVGGNREGLNFEQVGGLLVRLPGSSSQAEAMNTVYSSKRSQPQAGADHCRCDRATRPCTRYRRRGVMTDFYFGPTAHVLRLSLRYVEPEVWRRVVIASDMPLPKFAAALEQAMGWDSTHLHLFDVAGVLFGNTQHDAPHLIDERVANVAHLLPRVGCSLKWDYDFGDNWEHDVVVEVIEPLDGKKKYPIVTAGERTCPPEDCGGTSGYEELLRVLSDPTDEEHESMVGWAPEGFDPKVFDLVAANRRLRAK